VHVWMIAAFQAMELHDCALGVHTPTRMAPRRAIPGPGRAASWGGPAVLRT
jgi:hypothetical protein